MRLALLVLALSLAACDADTAETSAFALDPDVAPVTGGDWARPAADATWQWQLAGTVTQTYWCELKERSHRSSPLRVRDALSGTPMLKGRRPVTITLSDDDRHTLAAWVRRPTTAQALAMRARIVLACADRPGDSHGQIASDLAVHTATVGKWRKRFAESGPDGLLDAPRPGAPRSITDDEVDRMIARTLESKPDEATHWSTRSMARASGMSQTAVSRIWRAFGLRPHVAETFKLSRDPLFVDKVRDVVGLYMSPPANALVLCVDEKPQIQALGRTAPVLPMTPGVAERQTHDYQRHGTTDLFAALDVHSGRVVGECRPRHCAADFCAFLDTVDAAIPADLDVHVVLDNASTHKAPLVKSWLLAHPRYVLHFTPTSSSWLNLVECWFSILTRRQLQRGVHPSVASLEAAIEAFVSATNENPRPFVWTKTADEILSSVARFCQRTSNSDHYDADVVDVDLAETPDATLRALQARGATVLCYFSAGSSEAVRDHAGGFAASDLGRPLDGYPDERWLDVRSQTVWAVMLARLDRAAARGCDGVEPDNVDGYANRTGFPLTARDQLAFNRNLANEAHRRGLAVALKNSGDQAADLVAYYDLSVNEQCHEFDECGQLAPFVAAGKPVLNAEYPGSRAAAQALAPSLCSRAAAEGLRTLILPVELNDAWRVSCF